jgi:hypothetical protein
MSLEDITELFDHTIFNIKSLQPEEALNYIAKYSNSKHAFHLKSDLQGFTYVEPWLFRRNRELFDMLSPLTGDISLSSFQQNSLLNKQVDDQLHTFCYTVSRSIANSILFISNILVKMFRELWVMTPQDIQKRKPEVHTKLKLLQVLLVRNTDNEEVDRFVEMEIVYSKNKSSKSKTEVQQILSEMLIQF